MTQRTAAKILGEIKALLNELEIVQRKTEISAPDRPYDEVEQWLADSMLLMEDKKAYKASQLFDLFKPSAAILVHIGFSDKPSGQLRLFGIFLRRYVGMVLNGRVLKVGITDGTSSYRVLKLES